MRFILGSALIAAACAVQLRLILLFSQMMDEVNGILPGDAQIPELGPSWLSGKVIKLHRQFFPNSKLRRRLYIGWTLETAIFLSGLACIIRFV